MPLVVHELRPVLEVMARCAKVDFSISIEVPSPDVAIEKLRIQHVIFALVQNALDACRGLADRAKVRLDVRSDRYAVDVSVTDSGSGIADAAKDSIFKPFFTTKPRGTGLALASCRAIVESHEGTIGFERVSSGGSRFWFRLPIMPA
jgi:signal transduction histidine kinase